jgi:hypothetical protein
MWLLQEEGSLTFCSQFRWCVAGSGTGAAGGTGGFGGFGASEYPVTL